MSYCRWSSDNFRSDVYIYEDAGGGWTTHVAGRKRIGDRPDDPHSWKWIQIIGDNPTPEQLAMWEEAKKKHKDWLNEDGPWQPVPEPWCGQSYNDSTPQACAARLKQMKADGLYIPDGVIEELESETVE
jgi:hypothetical protein